MCRYTAFQDDRNLYMLLEYIIGGELFTHLRKAGKFTNDHTRFYAAQIVMALQYLHNDSIVYRDLKPENLLLDLTGYLKITDFGFAKKVEDRCVRRLRPLRLSHRTRLVRRRPRASRLLCLLAHRPRAHSASHARRGDKGGEGGRADHRCHRLAGHGRCAARRSTSRPRSSRVRGTASPWIGGRSAFSSTRCSLGAPRPPPHPLSRLPPHPRRCVVVRPPAPSHLTLHHILPPYLLHPAPRWRLPNRAAVPPCRRSYPPFYDENPFGIYQKILQGKLEFPRHFETHARDLIRKLLTADRTKRIGNLKNGAEDIKKHKWYRGLNWAALYNKQMDAYIVPDVSSNDDTSQYDKYADSVEESGPLINSTKDQEVRPRPQPAASRPASLAAKISARARAAARLRVDSRPLPSLPCVPQLFCNF